MMGNPMVQCPEKGGSVVPRQSPFAVSLTEAERVKVEAMTRRYTSPYCEVVRAKVVLLAAEGWSNDEIAQRLDMPRPIVSKWRKRFCVEGMAGLQDRPRGGRPPAFSPSRDGER
jgi:DNA-directed RNA polymerase specialized sigma24 family protein